MENQIIEFYLIRVYENLQSIILDKDKIIMFYDNLEKYNTFAIFNNSNLTLMIFPRLKKISKMNSLTLNSKFTWAVANFSTERSHGLFSFFMSIILNIFLSK